MLRFAPSTNKPPRPKTTLAASLLLAFALGTPAQAEPPAVLVDIAPLHSLVAMVTGDLSTPTLLLAPGTSPHSYQLRPSEARALNRADIVIWMGEGLTPWLKAPIETMASDAVLLAVLDLSGWERLPLRHAASFETEDHDHEHDHDEREGADPHAWLSPDNAIIWLAAIAETLSSADPENGAQYRTNAAQSSAMLADLSAQIEAQTAALPANAYLLPHDALQYFEHRFSLPARGALTLSDATAPGPARLATLRAMVADGTLTCLLTDPTTNPAWAAVLLEGAGETPPRMGQIDFDGTLLTPGPGLYPALLSGVADTLTNCLG